MKAFSFIAKLVIILKIAALVCLLFSLPDSLLLYEIGTFPPLKSNAFFFFFVMIVVGDVNFIPPLLCIAGSLLILLLYLSSFVILLLAFKYKKLNRFFHYIFLLISVIDLAVCFTVNNTAYMISHLIPSVIYLAIAVINVVLLIKSRKAESFENQSIEEQKNEQA